MGLSLVRHEPTLLPERRQDDHGREAISLIPWQIGQGLPAPGEPDGRRRHAAYDAEYCKPAETALEGTGQTHTLPLDTVEHQQVSDVHEQRLPADERGPPPEPSSA